MRNRIIIFIILLANVISMEAQKLIPKRFELLTTDLLARKEQRTSQANGTKCAAIRVNVVGVKDMTFKEAEGDCKYSMNEYIVYVPAGTQALTYKVGNEEGKIEFADYGPAEVEENATYRLLIDTENKMRSAVFYVSPSNAQLNVNGQNVQLDENGTGCIELPVGNYSYSITADKCDAEEGTFSLTEDEIVCVKDIVLNEKKYNLAIQCNHPEAAVFIDNISFGTLNSIQNNVQLTEGKHEVRITLENYKDYNETVDIHSEAASMNVNLEELKTKTIRRSELRTKSSISLRPHIDGYLSWNTKLDDMETNFGKLDFEIHQYLGYFAFKEGFSVGAVYGSKKFCNKIDKHLGELREDAEEKAKTRVAFYAEIPLQIGFALPLSLYNTSHVVFLGGGYGSYYYIGHKHDNMTTNKTVETNTFDFGIRINATFYLNKFAIGFEASRSLSDTKLGEFIGIRIGRRFYF